MEDTLTITLRKPVALGKDDAAITYDKIELREPMAGELDKAAAAPTDHASNILLISLVADVPKAVVERIGARDFMEAVRFLRNFIQAGADRDGSEAA